MGIKFYDSNGKYWGEYDETRNLFIPSEETITQTETQNSNLTFEKADEPQSEQWHYDEKDNTWYPYQHKSCATCKHALGNWDGESNNCGRCCGADRRFYEPIENEQTKRSE